MEPVFFKIDLTSFTCQAVDIVGESKADYTCQQVDTTVVSDAVIYRLTYRRESAKYNLFGLESTDLKVLDEAYTGRVLEQLQGIDWASHADVVTFRLHGHEQAAGTEFQVDRRILCARSEYFSRMFGSQMAEARKGLVELPAQVGKDAFRCLVEFLHTDYIDPMRILGAGGRDEMDVDLQRACGKLSVEVAKLGDLYQLPRLRRLAEMSVIEQALSADTALDLLVEVHSTGLEVLESACFNYIVRHWAHGKYQWNDSLLEIARVRPEVVHDLLMRVR